MTEHVEGTSTLTSWEENTYSDRGAAGSLTRAGIGQSLSSGLTGQSAAELLMCYRPDGTADFTGLQQVTGELGGRAGSFVLQATGSYDGSQASTRWRVIPGSGTGDLRGLRGSGASAAPGGPEGSFILDYWLEAAKPRQETTSQQTPPHPSSQPG